MPNFSLMIYDKPRKWITDSRAQGISWEEIDYGRKGDYAGLQRFLDIQADINFWPEMSISDWAQLVESQKNAEQRIKTIELLDGIAHIHDERQDNAITIQQCLSEAIERIFGEKCTIYGSSRTDKGVHAERFCCNFKTEKDRLEFIFRIFPI